jgi:curved DNA-binding protein CbpA
MSDGYFREILGVSKDAAREEIRSAYRRRVMENHPDRFPREKKAFQELATMTLTEAYYALMASTLPMEAAAADHAAEPNATTTDPGTRPEVPPGAVAAHRDHAYAYYKQGFINFSLAIHGVAEINRRLAAGRAVRSPRRYSAAEDIAESLAYLRAAHGYFSRVIEEHAESVWMADARMKLRRISRFTAIYRRILANIAASP